MALQDNYRLYTHTIHIYAHIYLVTAGSFRIFSWKSSTHETNDSLSYRVLHCRHETLQHFICPIQVYKLQSHYAANQQWIMHVRCWCFALWEDSSMQCTVLFGNIWMPIVWKIPCSWNNCCISIKPLSTKWHKCRPHVICRRGWLVGWLGFNGTLSMQVAAISCLRKFKVY